MIRMFLMAAMLGSGMPSGAAAQAGLPADQLEVIARNHAERNHIDLQEASRHAERKYMALQPIAELKELYSDRLDGAYWEEGRNLRFVLSIETGPLPSRPEIATTAGSVPVEFTLVSGRTVDDIRAILDANDDKLRTQLPGLQGTGVDIVTSQAVLYVFVSQCERGAYEEERPLERVARRPCQIRIPAGADAIRPATRNAATAIRAGRIACGKRRRGAPYVLGGSQILNLDTGNQCTGGFIVRDKATTKWGIATTAHCGKNLLYGNGSDKESGQQVTAKPTYENRIFDAEHDLAWHSFPLAGYRPLGEILRATHASIAELPSPTSPSLPPAMISVTVGC